MKKFWVLIFLVLDLFACKDAPTTPKAPVKPQLYATIVTFEFSPNECWYLEETKPTLRWEVTDSTAVNIDNGIGQVDAQGSLTLGPFSTTKNYTLSAHRDQTVVMKIATFTVKPRVVWHMSRYEWYPYPSGAWGIRGYITNIGNLTATNTRITYTAYDKNENVVETVSCYIGTVPPGRDGNFDCYFPHGYPYRTTLQITND